MSVEFGLLLLACASMVISVTRRNPVDVAGFSGIAIGLALAGGLVAITGQP